MNIPEKQLVAATGFGKLIAMRLLELNDVLAPLVRAALDAGYRGDVSGLRATLAWRVEDSRRGWELRRDRAIWDIHWALKPLFEERAPSTALLNTAHGINRAARGPLLGREVVAVVEDEVRWFLRRLESGKRRRAWGGRRRHAA